VLHSPAIGSKVATMGMLAGALGLLGDDECATPSSKEELPRSLCSELYSMP
jgi:hypothetical protein